MPLLSQLSAWLDWDACACDLLHQELNRFFGGDWERTVSWRGGKTPLLQPEDSEVSEVQQMHDGLASCVTVPELRIRLRRILLRCVQSF